MPGRSLTGKARPIDVRISGRDAALRRRAQLMHDQAINRFPEVPELVHDAPRPI